jgi:hypothetical protein
MDCAVRHGVFGEAPLHCLDCPFSQPISLWVIARRAAMVDQAFDAEFIELSPKFLSLVCHYFGWCPLASYDVCQECLCSMVAVPLWNGHRLYVF